jgi:glycosyltransferase involved in cell wall biosynthesis
MPKVSIVIASFNHENYVRECVQSALDQTFQDFEIIITDDGSPDGTVEVIKEFADPRIRLDTFMHNKGACTAINNCIPKAAGEYIAVLNSDDAWEPTKLAKQVKYLDEHPEIGAVFTKVAFVDESSKPISYTDYKHFYVFEQGNRPRYDWLNHFFFKGNCLCHPSILIRKKCYNEVGLYDERMASLPDLDMWVRLCLKYEIYILDEKLVRFRIRTDEANASGDRLPTHIRNHFEFMQILNHYLTIIDKQFFVKVFAKAKEYGEVESKYIPYFLGMLALKVEDSAWRLWGLQVLHNFIGKDVIDRGLEEKYGFRYRDFHNLTVKYDVFNLALARSALPSSQPTIRYINPGNHGKLVNFVMRLHWMLANFVLKIYARMN